MANFDLGNIERMVNNTVAITVSDIPLGDLDKKTIETCPNSLIVSAPQKGGKDSGYYGICCSDYRGNIVSLIPFNKINTEHFVINKSSNTDSEGALELSLNWENVITKPIQYSYNLLFDSLNNYVSNLNQKISYESNNLNQRITNEVGTLNTYINNVKLDYNTKIEDIYTMLKNYIDNKINEHLSNYHNSSYNPDNTYNNITPNRILSTNMLTDIDNTNEWEYTF